MFLDESIKSDSPDNLSAIYSNHGQIRQADEEFNSMLAEYWPEATNLYEIYLLLGNKKRNKFPITGEFSDERDQHWQSMRSFLDNLYKILPTSSCEREVQLVVEAQKNWEACKKYDQFRNVMMLIDDICHGGHGYTFTEELDESLKSVICARFFDRSPNKKLRLLVETNLFNTIALSFVEKFVEYLTDSDKFKKDHYFPLNLTFPCNHGEVVGAMKKAFAQCLEANEENLPQCVSRVLARYKDEQHRNDDDQCLMLPVFERDAIVLVIKKITELWKAEFAGCMDNNFKPIFFKHTFGSGDSHARENKKAVKSILTLLNNIVGSEFDEFYLTTGTRISDLKKCCKIISDSIDKFKGALDSQIVWSDAEYPLFLAIVATLIADAVAVMLKSFKTIVSKETRFPNDEHFLSNTVKYFLDVTDVELSSLAQRYDEIHRLKEALEIVENDATFFEPLFPFVKSDRNFVSALNCVRAGDIFTAHLEKYDKMRQVVNFDYTLQLLKKNHIRLIKELEKINETEKNEKIKRLDEFASEIALALDDWHKINPYNEMNRFSYKLKCLLDRLEKAVTKAAPDKDDPLLSDIIHSVESLKLSKESMTFDKPCEIQRAYVEFHCDRIMAAKLSTDDDPYRPGSIPKHVEGVINFLTALNECIDKRLRERFELWPEANTHDLVKFYRNSYQSLIITNNEQDHTLGKLRGEFPKIGNFEETSWLIHHFINKSFYPPSALPWELLLKYKYGITLALWHTQHLGRGLRNLIVTLNIEGRGKRQQQTLMNVPRHLRQELNERAQYVDDHEKRLRLALWKLDQLIVKEEIGKGNFAGCDRAKKFAEKLHDAGCFDLYSGRLKRARAKFKRAHDLYKQLTFRAWPKPGDELKKTDRVKEIVDLRIEHARCHIALNRVANLRWEKDPAKNNFGSAEYLFTQLDQNFDIEATQEYFCVYRQLRKFFYSPRLKAPGEFEITDKSDEHPLTAARQRYEQLFSALDKASVVKDTDQKIAENFIEFQIRRVKILAYQLGEIHESSRLVNFRLRPLLEMLYDNLKSGTLQNWIRAEAVIKLYADVCETRASLLRHKDNRHAPDCPTRGVEAKSLYEKAICGYEEVLAAYALEKHERHLCQIKLIKARHRLGKVYYDSKLLTEAKKQFLSAYRQAESIGFWQLLSKAARRLATISLNEMHVSQARALYNLALRWANRNGDRVGEAEILMALGRLETIERNYDQADRIFSLSLKICRKIKPHKLLINVLINYGRMAIKSDKLPLAKTMLLSALKEYYAYKEELQISSSNLLPQIIFRLARIYEVEYQDHIYATYNRFHGMHFLKPAGDHSILKSDGDHQDGLILWVRALLMFCVEMYKWKNIDQSSPANVDIHTLYTKKYLCNLLVHIIFNPDYQSKTEYWLEERAFRYLKNKVTLEPFKKHIIAAVHAFIKSASEVQSPMNPPLNTDDADEIRKNAEMVNKNLVNDIEKLFKNHKFHKDMSSWLDNTLKYKKSGGHEALIITLYEYYKNVLLPGFIYQHDHSSEADTLRSLCTLLFLNEKHKILMQSKKNQDKCDQIIKTKLQGSLEYEIWERISMAKFKESLDNEMWNNISIANFRECLEYAELALGISESIKDQPLRIRTLHLRMQIYLLAGDIEEALNCLRQSLAAVSSKDAANIEEGDKMLLTLKISAVKKRIKILEDFDSYDLQRQRKIRQGDFT